MTGPLAVGDAVPGPARTAIYEDGAAGWFALITRPQKERAVEGWLAARGVYSFHPVLVRATRIRGKVVRSERRYLPGYVFARFPGAPVCHAVMAFPMINDAIRMADGRWGLLDGGDLRRLHGMRSVDVEAARQERKDADRRRQAVRPRVGHGALFRSGPLAGQRCEVVSLDAVGGAVVRVTMFGGSSRVAAQEVDLVAVPEGVDR